MHPTRKCRVRLRNTCVVDDPAVLHLHDHVAWCGDGTDDLLQLAIDAFTVGAERNERMVFICDDPDARAAARERRPRSGARHGCADRSELSTRCTAARPHFDPAAQLEVFCGCARRGARGGLSRGPRSSPTTRRWSDGDDDSFARWLAWEQLTDSFQDSREVLGVCYFDATRIAADRLTVLGAVHPVTHDVDVLRSGCSSTTASSC